MTSNSTDSVVGTEHFATKNKFDGFQLGFTYQANYERAWLESRMRVALGNNRQTINIGGTNTVTTAAGTTTNEGGWLTYPSNSGNQTRDVFTMIPELGLTLGICLTNRIQGTVGYSVLYYPNVVRAGDQIDTDVNPFQPLVPFPARPSRNSSKTIFGHTV